MNQGPLERVIPVWVGYIESLTQAVLSGPEFSGYTGWKSVEEYWKARLDEYSHVETLIFVLLIIMWDVAKSILS